MSFGRRLRKTTGKIEESLDKTLRAIVIAIFNEVIQRTRVDTGRAKGNWQTSVSARKLGELVRLDPSGTKAMAEVVANVEAYALNIITNNLPYIQKLEELDGMVSLAVARIKRIIKEKS